MNYALTISGPSAPGSNPFYFFEHGITSRPLETGGNQTQATAETLTPEADGKTFYISGSVPALSADWFKIAPPSGSTHVAYYCYGVQEGSGLTIRAQLIQSDGTTLTGTDLTESATMVAGAANVSLPSGSLFLEVTNVVQDATVTDNHYDCEVFF